MAFLEPFQHSWMRMAKGILEALRRYAYLGRGIQNSFGHPHPTVLERLEKRHAAILRTDQDGLVTVRSDGHKLWFDSIVMASRNSADVFNWALADELNR